MDWETTLHVARAGAQVVLGFGAGLMGLAIMAGLLDGWRR